MLTLQFWPSLPYKSNQVNPTSLTKIKLELADWIQTKANKLFSDLISKENKIFLLILGLQ